MRTVHPTVAMSVEAFITQSERCSTVSELAALHKRAIAEEGYDNVVFCRVSPDGRIAVLWSKVPIGFAEVYHRYNMQARDPILMRARETTGLIRWADLEAGVLTAAERHMLETCRIMGVHSGLSFAFHGPDGGCDVFSVSMESNRSPDPARAPFVQAKSLQAWNRYWQIVGASKRERPTAASCTDIAPSRQQTLSGDKRCEHRGGPPGMLTAHCRTLMYVDVAARRREMGLSDTSNGLSLSCQDPEIIFLLKWGLIVESKRRGEPCVLAPSVLGRNHLATCPAAAELRREIWSLDIRRGERPKVD